MNNTENKPDELLECEFGNTEDDYFFIPIDCTDQTELKIDNKLFSDGMKEYSAAAGAITVLCNAGLKPSEALEYIINKDTIKHNIEVSNITANATIESAKYASIKGEMESL